ncbi:MAG: hypothetical protein ACTSYD_08105 [Candidatus Heimdallarchaeaceae archaeon]
MYSYRFIIFAPTLDFTKQDLYNNPERFYEQGQYIKSISDAFFLSNHFRHNLTLFYYTCINNENYTIALDGSKLRYLGPSFFSAAHLLLRAKRHIKDPSSKAGKLTPGLSVRKTTAEEVLDSVHLSKATFITNKSERNNSLNNWQIEITQIDTFLFGNIPKEWYNILPTISFGPLFVDEQVILTNYYLIDKRQYYGSSESR